MTFEDKAKLEKLYNSNRRTKQKFSTLELDEFVVDAINEGKDTNEILKEVRDKFNLKLTRVQLQGRLCNLRHRGITVNYRYNVKNGKRVPGTLGKIARRSKKPSRRPRRRAVNSVQHHSTNPVSSIKTDLRVSNLARIGTILRYNENSEELTDKYVSEVVREAVRTDLKRLGV